MRTTQTILVAAALAGLGGARLSADPHAVEIIRAQGPFGPAPYDDPLAVLGPPTTRFHDPFGGLSGGTTHRRVKLVEPAFNIAADTNGLPTPNLLLTFEVGSEVIVRFDQAVSNNPVNPYGVDLLVFGNAFYAHHASVNDGTDMSGLILTGDALDEPLKISVSPGYTGQPGETAGDPDTWPWHRFDAGPYGDAPFPTQAFRWDRATTNWTEDLLDFTKPVNPALATDLAAGGWSAADAIDLYAGAGGGTGFDLADSGFAWIQYIKVDGLDPGFSGGEIDAFSAVRPLIVGDAACLAPQNLSDDTAALYFQWAGLETVTRVCVRFNSLSERALVSTESLDDFASFAVLPGIPLNAIELSVTPIPGTNRVMFGAEVTLSAGPGYGGDGTDLCLLQSSGTHWNPLPFDFDPIHLQVTTALTNTSALAVVQLAAPAPVINVIPGAVRVTFDPIPGLLHLLERSTNLIAWTCLSGFTATNAEPVVLLDQSPPQPQAFYRLHVLQP